MRAEEDGERVTVGGSSQNASMRVQGGDGWGVCGHHVDDAQAAAVRGHAESVPLVALLAGVAVPV